MQSYLNKPKQIIIWAKDSQGRKLKKFEHPIVYISFSSQAGCTLQLNLKAVSTLPNISSKQTAAVAGAAGPVDADKLPNVMKNQQLNMQQINDIIPRDDPYYQEMLN